MQKYIDSKVVSYCDKYVPFQTGTLKKAIGTVYGSGIVRYGVNYAKNQYYNNQGRSGREGMANGGLRGRLWFERMKTAHLQDILHGAAKLAGAGKTRR